MELDFSTNSHVVKRFYFKSLPRFDR